MMTFNIINFVFGIDLAIVHAAGFSEIGEKFFGGDAAVFFGQLFKDLIVFLSQTKTQFSRQGCFYHGLLRRIMYVMLSLIPGRAGCVNKLKCWL